jgi:hypothetical protein
MRKNRELRNRGAGEPPIFVRDNEGKRLIGPNARLRSITGFAPSIPLEETLRWMYSEPL